LHIDNLDELQAVHSIARRLNCHAKVGFRLRFGKESKFGFSPEDEELTRAIGLLSNSQDLSLVAIHHHDADTLNTTQGIEETLGAIQRIRDRLAECTGGRDLEVDLGGGSTSLANGRSFPITRSSFTHFDLLHVALAHKTGHLGLSGGERCLVHAGQLLPG
jgi:diaminopimelate decarboxylase